MDGQHTVFGKVVGGMDVLKKLEAIPVDKKDKPERDIRIKQIQVFVDPFEEYQTRLQKKLAHEANADAEDEEARLKREKQDRMGWFGPNVTKKEDAQVGKYMNEESSKRKPEETKDVIYEEEIGVSQKKQKILSQEKKTMSYGNFDNF